MNNGFVFSTLWCPTDCLMDEICRYRMRICIRLPCKQLIEQCSRKFMDVLPDDERCFSSRSFKVFSSENRMSAIRFSLSDQSSIVSLGSQLWQPIDKTIRVRLKAFAFSRRSTKAKQVQEMFSLAICIVSQSQYVFVCVNKKEKEEMYTMIGKGTKQRRKERNQD